MSERPIFQFLNRFSSLLRPLVWAFVGGVLAAAISILMPNYYMSEARILPLDSRSSSSGLGGLAGTAAALGFALPTGDGSDANFVDILNSRWLKGQLVNTVFEFHERPWRFGEEKLRKESLASYFKAKTDDAAIRGLGVIMTTSRDFKSRVITISVETKSPELSQQVAQCAVKLLERFNLQKGRTRGGAKAAFADARLKEARHELEDAEKALRLFLKVNRGYQTSSDPDTRLEGGRLETDYRLRQQLLNSIAMNREQALMEEKNDIPILNVLDGGNLPQEKSRPKRANIVKLAMVFSGLCAWFWGNRSWITGKILANLEAPADVDRS